MNNKSFLGNVNNFPTKGRKTQPPIRSDSMTSKTDEEIAEKAIMSLRFHPNLEDQVKFCDPGNINVILEAIRESKSAARQDTERLDWVESATRLPVEEDANKKRHVLACSRFNTVSIEHFEQIRSAPIYFPYWQKLPPAARCGLDEGEKKKQMPTKEDIHKLRGIFKRTEPHKAEDASKQKELRMVPTELEKREWRRMATDAYDKDLNDLGHRCSSYGALRISESIPIQVFDEMQMNYREWLISGFTGILEAQDEHEQALMGIIQSAHEEQDR